MAYRYLIYDDENIAVTKDKEVAYHFMQELIKRGIKVSVEQTKEEKEWLMIS